MRMIRTLGAALGLVAFGYLLGTSGGVGSILSLAYAQDAAADPNAAQSDQSETNQKVEAAIAAIDAAMQALIEQKRYVPAIQGLNGFAVTAGGGDMVKALDEGKTVDPETYVGLYAGLAVPEIVDKLDKNDEGQLTYDGKVVRMYPIGELRRLYQARSVIAADLKEKR